MGRAGARGLIGGAVACLVHGSDADLLQFGGACDLVLVQLVHVLVSIHASDLVLLVRALYRKLAPILHKADHRLIAHEVEVCLCVLVDSLDQLGNLRIVFGYIFLELVPECRDEPE